jgi:hypothetical protein
MKQVESSAYFSLGLFLDSEDGAEIFLRNDSEFQRTARRFIPEDGTRLHSLCS